MYRRNFLGLTATAGALWWLNGHSAFLTAGCHAAKPTGGTARIAALRLLTSASMDEMKKFYGDIIGLHVEEKTGGLDVHAGETIISFVKTDNMSVRPFYHFAFNIPENKIQKAFEWQRKRTPVVHPNPEGTKDQVVHFAHWNAHSIFFLDPAGNLVEYIARHDLRNAAGGAFNTADILYASEIGLIVDDVNVSGKELQKGIAIQQYREPTPGFWPIGDETGLLLMIHRGRNWVARPGEKNETAVFETTVTIRSPEKGNWKMPGYPYEILFGSE